MRSAAMVHQTAGRRAAASVARRRSTGYAPSTRRPGWLTYLVLGIVVIGSALPLYWAFLVGSRDSSVLSGGMPPLLPGGNFLATVQRVLDAIPFWTALSNSLIVATVVAFSVVLFATLAGYAFSKLSFRGRSQLFVFVVATMAVPTQLGVVPLFILMSKLGWTGSLWAVIMPNLVTAFGVFWMTQYLESALPAELIDAARIDGCSMIRTFWHVALPAARPAAVMLGLFTFISSWTNFFWPFIVLSPSNPTLPVALSALQQAHYVDYSLILTGVVLATAPLVLLFVVAGRQLVSGIMQGAVKG